MSLTEQHATRLRSAGCSGLLAGQREQEALGLARRRQKGGTKQSPLPSATSSRNLQRLSLGGGACVGERFAPRLGSSAGGAGFGAARVEAGGVLRGGAAVGLGDTAQ